jgi:arylsulfatase A-like enzyme
VLGATALPPAGWGQAAGGSEPAAPDAARRAEPGLKRLPELRAQHLPAPTVGVNPARPGLGPRSPGRRSADNSLAVHAVPEAGLGGADRAEAPGGPGAGGQRPSKAHTHPGPGAGGQRPSQADAQPPLRPGEPGRFNRVGGLGGSATPEAGCRLPASMRRRLRSLLPSPTLLLAAAALGCGGTGAATAPGPHPIIIVDVDTLRADHLSCYGYGRPTSPNLDAFAADAVRFEWAFSQAPNTPPSQTSILTSLYPSTHGMVFDEDKVPEEVTTLAEALAAQGYTTAGFVDGGYMSNSFQMGQGFALYDDNRGGGLARIGPKVSDWLDKHAHESFLLLVHTYDVHTPYDPPEPFHDLFLGGLAPPTPGFEPNPEQMEAIRLSVWTPNPRKLPPNDLENARALYDAGIRYVDDWFGGLVAQLSRLGLYDRTTLVVISDHGEEFQEHGSVLHEKLYATVTHIPLLLRAPGLGGGRTVPDVVESIDLMPTLLDLAGAPQPPGLQGRSLLPLLTGKPRGPARAFGESPFFGRRRFIARSRYRLLLTEKTGAVELYDFVADPAEQHDLAAAMPERAASLRSDLLAWRQQLAERGKAGAAAAPGGSVDEETEKQLKALGYVK